MTKTKVVLESVSYYYTIAIWDRQLDCNCVLTQWNSCCRLITDRLNVVHLPHRSVIDKRSLAVHPRLMDILHTWTLTLNHVTVPAHQRTRVYLPTLTSLKTERSQVRYITGHKCKTRYMFKRTQSVQCLPVKYHKK